MSCNATCYKRNTCNTRWHLFAIFRAISQPIKGCILKLNHAYTFSRIPPPTAPKIATSHLRTYLATWQISRAHRQTAQFCTVAGRSDDFIKALDIARRKRLLATTVLRTNCSRIRDDFRTSTNRLACVLTVMSPAQTQSTYLVVPDPGSIPIGPWLP
eukprot:1695889-Pleurochrysis_carterae.AAC.1